MLLSRYDHTKRRAKILAEISLERRLQDEKWGGPGHDDEHDRDMWIRLLRKHQQRALRAVIKGDLDDYRKHMVRVAALSVAALEAHDRRSGE